MSKRLSYDALRLAYDDRDDKSTPFFEHIVVLCLQSSQWWETLRLWWDRMDSECRRLFLHYLIENDETKFLYDLIDNRISL